MEDHLVAMSERVDHMAILGSELPLAAIEAFRALWPEKPVPKKVSELCEWVKATKARLIEWRDSAGRVGIYIALQVLLSWYEGIDLNSLRTIRAESKYYTDPAAKKELEKRACSLLQFAGVHEYFKDVDEPDESEEDDSDDDDDSDSEQVDETIDELIISEQYRQRAAPADPLAPSTSGTTGTGVDSDAAVA